MKKKIALILTSLVFFLLLIIFAVLTPNMIGVILYNKEKKVDSHLLKISALDTQYAKATKYFFQGNLIFLNASKEVEEISESGTKPLEADARKEFAEALELALIHYRQAASFIENEQKYDLLYEDVAKNTEIVVNLINLMKQEQEQEQQKQDQQGEDQDQQNQQGQDQQQQDQQGQDQQQGSENSENQQGNQGTEQESQDQTASQSQQQEASQGEDSQQDQQSAQLSSEENAAADQSPSSSQDENSAETQDPSVAKDGNDKDEESPEAEEARAILEQEKSKIDKKEYYYYQKGGNYDVEKDW
ncbi:MAG: hypothetical protein JXR63_06220 [Spirochaetales bacterium]|nr:hypothetical protein [Spirochaetales bacterium]